MKEISVGTKLSNHDHERKPPRRIRAVRIPNGAYGKRGKQEGEGLRRHTILLSIDLLFFPHHLAHPSSYASNRLPKFERRKCPTSPPPLPLFPPSPSTPPSLSLPCSSRFLPSGKRKKNKKNK
ncbi:hypothetical protein IE53DRAFT_177271 [Violaceomyces palustris]|uniref:Uncharacterized protein n=1 Tax=Violaceomyces palustris TaxID=1673888 RepID=A0ACD0P5X7_9BASI|nr:hypothetical protein IE53DRAFT_177271 [Violaceomyces palustris]